MFRSGLTKLEHSLNEEYYDSLSTQPSINYSDVGQEEGHSGSEQDGLALHRAAFYNELDSLEQLLQELSPAQRVKLDPQGNTALHVAVLRRNLQAIELLLQAGVSPEVKNRRRWTPLDEAISMDDAAVTKLLFARLKADAKAEMKRKKAHLLAIMTELPDFKMQLRWELGSPLFGLLLRRYAPDDTYQIYKLGTQLRMDGSLMGLDDKRKSLIPQWKRGSFSLLINAGTTPVTSYFVNHGDRSYVDLYKERKAQQKGIDHDVAELLKEGPGKVKMKTDGLEFRPVKSWLGRPCTEKVEGWQTELYECVGQLVATTHEISRAELPPDATYEDYLRLSLPEDKVEEIPLDPLHPPPPPSSAASEGSNASPFAIASAGSGPMKQKEKLKEKDKTRKFSGKCWMARNFPMSLRQLLPLLEAVASGNKHFTKAADFMQRFGDQSLFPVRIQVPIIWTVYLLISFRDFKLLGLGDPCRQPGFFQLPDGYRRVTFDEAVGKSVLVERLDSGELKLPVA